MKRWLSISRQAAEAVAVISAFMFVASAIFNAAMFSIRWKISYFSVATPADVAMDAFAAAAFVAVALFVMTPLAAVIYAGRYGRTARQMRVIAVALFFVIGYSILMIAVFGSGLSVIVNNPEITSRRLVSPSRLYKECGPAPVLWVGTSSIVLLCKGAVWTLKDAQGMIWR